MKRPVMSSPTNIPLSKGAQEIIEEDGGETEELILKGESSVPVYGKFKITLSPSAPAGFGSLKWEERLPTLCPRLSLNMSQNLKEINPTLKGRISPGSLSPPAITTVRKNSSPSEFGGIGSSRRRKISMALAPIPKEVLSLMMEHRSTSPILIPSRKESPSALFMAASRHQVFLLSFCSFPFS